MAQPGPARNGRRCCRWGTVGSQEPTRVVGPVTEERLVSLPDLSDALWCWKEKGDEKPLRKMLIPPTELMDLPRIWLNAEGGKLFGRGAPLTGAAIARTDENIGAKQSVLLLSLDGKLMGVGKTEAEISGKTYRAPAVAVRPQVVLAKPSD